MTPDFYSNISRLQLEVTTDCNASCPQCARNYNGARVPRAGLPSVQMTLADAQTIFPVAFIKQLTSVLICGAYGDALMCDEAALICKYFRQSGSDKLWMSIHTNGGARSPAWWTELGKWTNEIRFGIDGLKDTHEIYRQGTMWDKVIRNAQAAKLGGCKIIWKMNAFEHNEHQIEECREISKTLGFDDFELVRTSRFMSQNNTAAEAMPVLNSTATQVIHWLRPPKSEQYRNDILDLATPVPPLSDEKTVEKAQRSIDWERGNVGIGLPQKNIDEFIALSKGTRLETSVISCKAINNGLLNVDAHGNVWPCTHMARDLNVSGIITAQNVQMLDKVGGQHLISGKQFSIKEIVEGPFFAEVASRFNKTFEDGRLSACANYCGDASMCHSQFQGGAYNKMG